ncbi:MAG TPA: hypothetical protein VFP32_03830 [Candidatus Saccharimonadales bacterium]|nr:hypothetical protein [Candidatus Saccharimonadales bacterium]
MSQHELTADPFRVKVEFLAGRRHLRVSRPVKLGFAPEETGILALYFDASGLCASNQECTRIEGSSSHSCRRFDLLLVPLAPDVPSRGAEARGRSVLRQALEAVNIERTRQLELAEELKKAKRHNVSSPRPKTHRTYAPSRCDGQVGAPA